MITILEAKKMESTLRIEGLNEIIQLGDVIVERLDELDTNSEAIDKWILEQFMGNRDEMSKHEVFRMARESWWQKEVDHSGGLVSTRGLRLFIPAYNENNQIIGGSKVLFISTNAGGFGIAYPYFSMKEAESSILRSAFENKLLKKMPFLKVGNPTEKLTEYGREQLLTIRWVKVSEIAKRKSYDIWYVINQALESEECEEKLGEETALQLRKDWHHLSHESNRQAYVSSDELEQDWSYYVNLPLAGYPLSMDISDPFALTFSDLKPGMQAWKIIYEGYEPIRPTYHKEILKPHAVRPYPN